MSRNSLVLLPVLAVAVVACAGAAPATCPSSITDTGVSHQLVNASLFDGHPDQMADLVPVPAGAVDRWKLDSVDPYLVCRFQGTQRVTTLHAVAAKTCEAGGKPFRAYCKG